ncbi:cytochrome C oxidase subunit IV family protein [Pelagibacterium lentulum]|uniref:Cytochrome c oxidase subunit IV n=1 Tax=Pelagibacterium lentulum TaxID=2029865 RepID=A0A916RE86_9HYPH|nr:cytochrome C oxidase subunit IV family protein [Pelagibacterium lentulum]GGA52799.1 cytochrome c oxidase subunit IV [Pelagibacterium lentulum]
MDQSETHTETHQQHPIKLYLVVWGWLFVLSIFSYMVDIIDFRGLLRWSLVVTLMMLKAGLIVAVFMHMAWERLALTYAMLVPPVLILVFVVMMIFEGGYTEWMRLVFLDKADANALAGDIGAAGY